MEQLPGLTFVCLRFLRPRCNEFLFVFASGLSPFMNVCALVFVRSVLSRPFKRPDRVQQIKISQNFLIIEGASAAAATTRTS